MLAKFKVDEWLDFRLVIAELPRRHFSPDVGHSTAFVGFSNMDKNGFALSSPKINPCL